MNNEYLKIFKEKIGHCSDDTWIYNENNLPYQRANLELYKIDEILSTTTKRPRSVRECIPFSRLSKYCNSTYVESRELCYRSTFCPETTVRLSDQFEDVEVKDKEPWMLAEVDDLYEWFTLPMAQPIFDLFEYKHFDVPIMAANGFEEKVLKMRLTSDKVRRIWEETDNHTTIVQDSIKTVYKTASQQLICKRINENFTEFQEQSQEFQHIENLTKSLQDQTNVIKYWLNSMKNIKHFNCNKSNSPLDSVLVNDKRLYSAVLQGSNEEPTNSTNRNFFIPLIIPNRLHMSHQKYWLNNNQLDPVLVNNKRLYSAVLQGANTFESGQTAPQMVVVSNNNQQYRKIPANSNTRNFFIPLIIPNRLQTPLFSPQIVPINSMTVNQFLMPNLSMPQLSNRSNWSDIRSKTWCSMFERKISENYVPLKKSTSKDLEAEAIEQYSENLSTLEDLERQATEQYEQ